MLATDRQVSREVRTVPALSIGRKIGPLPRDPAIVLATVWIGTASSEMQLRRREVSGPSQ